MEALKLWVLKSVTDEERAFQTIDSYKDEISKNYNYDSKVANFKQIKPNDYAIIIDKRKILGFAIINKVDVTDDIKYIKKCPDCGSSTIDTRKKSIPIYRCNKGHEFDNPKEQKTDIKRFSAIYENSYIPYTSNHISLLGLRPFYTKNYNQNMSMQLLDMDALKLFPEFKHQKSNIKKDLKAEESWTPKEVNDSYLKNNEDERETVLKQIKARRGQQKFRNDLRERYGNQCAITGSKVLDILEAAHINPYRGDNDNHPSNGLLLRADIHTLFDLNLLAIEPDSLIVKTSHLLEGTEYENLNDTKLLCKALRPNEDALKYRWAYFKLD